MVVACHKRGHSFSSSRGESPGCIQHTCRVPSPAPPPGPLPLPRQGLEDVSVCILINVRTHWLYFSPCSFPNQENLIWTTDNLAWRCMRKGLGIYWVKLWERSALKGRRSGLCSQTWEWRGGAVELDKTRERATRVWFMFHPNYMRLFFHFYSMMRSEDCHSRLLISVRSDHFICTSVWFLKTTKFSWTINISKG